MGRVISNVKNSLETPKQAVINGELNTAEAWGSGKLILFGEHAVVYGRPAVAVALSRGLKVTVSSTRDLSSSLEDQNPRPISAVLCSQGRLNSLQHTESRALLTALTQGLEWSQAQGLPLLGEYQFKVEGELPFKVGLGSSAALSVASLRAIAKLSYHHHSNQAIFEGAMCMERVFHQNPSGLDHQVSILGGALRFRRDGARFDHRSITLGVPLYLALTWTPRVGSTADAVRGVAQAYAYDHERYEELFSQIESISEEGVNALEKGDLLSLGRLLNENHQLLKEIGVSTPTLDAHCTELINLGAIGAKMSGAGHGGACFGLFLSKFEAENAALSLKRRGVEALAISLGELIKAVL